MLNLRIQTGPRRYVAPADLVSVLGAERAVLELGDMVEALIAQIDTLAGDVDMEETDAEDSFAPPAFALHFAEGPGCAVSDVGDVTWTEWHNRTGRRGKACFYEPIGYLPSGCVAGDDDEEDDPAGQCDEDGVNTSLSAARAYQGPGCDISDPDKGIEDERQDEPDGQPLAVLSWGMDQSEPLPFDPTADRRIMQDHRDYIRTKSYHAIPAHWRGDPPTYATAPAANVGDLVPVSRPNLEVIRGGL